MERLATATSMDIQDVGRRVYRHNKQLMTRERALANAMAAGEIGGITLRILNNEGEAYSHSPTSGPNKGRVFKSVVPEGKVYVARSGGIPENGAFHDRAEQIQAELEQHKKAA